MTNPSGWFIFPDMQGVKSTLDLRPGGLWTMQTPDGAQTFMAQVTLIEPEKLLRVSGPFGLSHLPVNNVMIYELQPQNDGKTTLLRVGQRTFGYVDADLQSRYSGGWKKFLEAIKNLAEK